MTKRPRCEVCAAPFTPTRASRRYCSNRCREAAKSRRRRGRQPAPATGEIVEAVPVDKELA